MGRRSRALSAGGIYDVHNRVSGGVHVFRDEGEADRFEALLAATTALDDFQILASTPGCTLLALFLSRYPVVTLYWDDFLPSSSGTLRTPRRDAVFFWKDAIGGTL